MAAQQSLCLLSVCSMLIIHLNKENWRVIAICKNREVRAKLERWGMYTVLCNCIRSKFCTLVKWICYQFQQMYNSIVMHFSYRVSSNMFWAHVAIFRDVQTRMQLQLCFCWYRYCVWYALIICYGQECLLSFICFDFQECNQNQKRDFGTYNKWWSSEWPLPCHELVLTVRCWSGWQCHNPNTHQFYSEGPASHCVTATFECPVCGSGEAPFFLPCGKEKQAGGG